MKKLMLMVCVLALACPALTVAQETPKQETVDITGTWDLTMETPNGSATLTANYKQDGTKLTGTQSGPMDSPASPIEGTVTGSEVKYTMAFDMQGQQMTITFSAKVDGSTLAGTFDFGGMGSAPFSGKKRQ